MRADALEKTAALDGQIEFTEDILVFAYLAVHWSDSGPSYGPAVRGWGHELRSGSIPVGNHRYTAAKTLSDKHPEALAKYGAGRLGLFIVKSIDVMNGGKERKTWWVPLESMKAATLRLGGVELA